MSNDRSDPGTSGFGKPRISISSCDTGISIPYVKERKAYNNPPPSAIQNKKKISSQQNFTITKPPKIDSNLMKNIEREAQYSISSSSLFSYTQYEETRQVQTYNTAKAEGAKCPAVSTSTSHTQYFRREPYAKKLRRITTDEYCGHQESMSTSSDTFQCLHGPAGKQYTKLGQLKHDFTKKLDPIPAKTEKLKPCDPVYGWDMAKKLSYLVQDKVGVQQVDRLISHMEDLAKISENGFRIDVLPEIEDILSFLLEKYSTNSDFKKCLALLLQNINKPIQLNVSSDVVTHFGTLCHFFVYLGYLLACLGDHDLFDLVSRGVQWQLAAPDSVRCQGCVKLRHAVAAGAPGLHHTIVRMLAVANSHKYPTFLQLALIFACDSVDNCLSMMQDNIIENIFYRFNPYFPDKCLPAYDINPTNLRDVNVRLGVSSTNLQTTLSLLLVLIKTVMKHLEKEPRYVLLIPHPDEYALRCFIWAYRYECRAPSRSHQRKTMTVVIMSLLKIFGDRLSPLATLLMGDVMTLSVSSLVPPRQDWTSTVNVTASQKDVQFIKSLINFSVMLLKQFPYNDYFVEQRHWLLGLMYLLDPGLSSLRMRWPPSLFSEIRKVALQALVCVLPLIPFHMVKNYGLIRRILWYIEWYSEKPYELSVLYWCLRVLQTATSSRNTAQREAAINDLYETHGIIVLMNLCQTLLEQKVTPVEKAQVILALALRLITSFVQDPRRVTCCVYPEIKWPASVNSMARNMLEVASYALEKHYIVNGRWLVATLNFIWEAVVWKETYRTKFIAKKGVYKLLDLITMADRPVKCMAMALLCDMAKDSASVCQLVTWRANMCAADARHVLVKQGTTIAGLLSAIFKEDCEVYGISLDENGVIKDLDNFLMSKHIRDVIRSPNSNMSKHARTPVCFAASDVAGSLMSKAFALLYMLSEDLDYKVSITDEAYNLFKNIKLEPIEETVLVLCSHYLTMKLNETWYETYTQSIGYVAEDEDLLSEFLDIGRGWAKEIKRQQENVLNMDKSKDSGEESSLYEFLGRIRLNIALDALREVRCVARSADRTRFAHSLLHDAVHAHQRRSVMVELMEAPVLRTYGPTLDEQNLTGQNVKVNSIASRYKKKVGKSNPTSRACMK